MICNQCGREVKYLSRGLCSSCYKYKFQRRACDICGKPRVVYAKGVCRQCWYKYYDDHLGGKNIKGIITPEAKIKYGKKGARATRKILGMIEVNVYCNECGGIVIWNSETSASCVNCGLVIIED